MHRHFARGIAKHDEDASQIKADGMHVLLKNRSLLVLAASLPAFNLGNSAMLPLYSLALSAAHWADPSAIMSANIVISQVVMLIAAAYANRLIRRFGFWWIILATLARDAALARGGGGAGRAVVGDRAGAGLRWHRREFAERRGARLIVHLLPWQRAGESRAGRGAGRGGGRVPESTARRMGRAALRLSGSVSRVVEFVDYRVRDLDQA